MDEESLVAFSDLAIGAYDKDQGELECSNEEMLDLPNGFLETVLPEMDGSDPFALRGSTSAYAAMPVERAQRLSTVASAANAMQLAMSLSAVLPAQGLSVNGGAAYREIAMGTIDALERAPLVVGFADRGAPTNDKADNRARFGWLFGPPIRVDTENDRLVHRHVVANHRVLADMSVPAWWPSVTLKVHSAWIGNWDDPDEAIASASEFERRGRDRFMDVEKEARETSCGKRLANQFCQEIQDELPQTSADFHALTNKLAGAVLRQPLRAPSIDRIVPSAVTACAGEVQFFVYGNELWRAPIATLRGMRAKTPEVLPDMAGIAVTFDINSLPASPTPQLPDRLWIVTQNGPVGETITIAGDRTKPAENCGVKASAPKLALKLASSPVLDQSAPSSLSFKVTNGELPKAYHSLLMELKPVNPPDTEPQQEPLLVSDNRKMLKTKAFSVPTPAQRAAEMTDPSLVASIKVQLSPPYSDVLKPAVLAKDIRLLRCSSERTCLHTLVEPVSVSDPNDSIKIVLRVPRGYGRIYPGLGTGTSFLGAYIDYFENGVAKRIDLLPAAVEFPKDEAWRTDRESEVIAVLGPPLDENNRVDPQYENLLKSQGAKLRLRWVMSEGADAPEIPDLDILLQL